MYAIPFPASGYDFCDQDDNGLRLGRYVMFTLGELYLALNVLVLREDLSGTLFFTGASRRKRRFRLSKSWAGVMLRSYSELFIEV